MSRDLHNLAFKLRHVSKIRTHRMHPVTFTPLHSHALYALQTCDKGPTHATANSVGIKRQNASTLGVSDVLTLRTENSPSPIEQQNTHWGTNHQSSQHCKLIRSAKTDAAELLIPAIFYASLTSQLKKSPSGYCVDKKKGNPWILKVTVWWECLK